MSARAIIESLPATVLQEIALQPGYEPEPTGRSEIEVEFDDSEFADEPDDLDPETLAAVERDHSQETEWYNVASESNVTREDVLETAKTHGLESPSAAVSTAFQQAGSTFPRRGGWSGELVWLFLTLRDRGLVDERGMPK